MAAVGNGVRYFKIVGTFVPRRFNSIACHKLIYSNYGEPAAVVRLEKETLEPPGPGKVCIDENSHCQPSRLLKVLNDEITFPAGLGKNVGCPRQSSGYKHYSGGVSS